MKTTEFKIEDIEAMVAQMEADEAMRRAKLVRLIAAEARIVALREPSKFVSMPTELSDEDGHWDNSYPPAAQYKNRTGPRLLEVVDNTTQDIATSSGFYHDWKRVTEDKGLWVGTRGELYGCMETGTGRFGQFAAHPGDCGVEVELEWERWDDEDLSTEALEKAEKTLRALAFPASVA
jgi:hypothetical protein